LWSVTEESREVFEDRFAADNGLSPRLTICCIARKMGARMKRIAPPPGLGQRVEVRL